MPDAIVIGGGFYGASIAHYLKATRGLREVVLLERDGRLLGRSSYVNQARVHCGYHYPRSFTTAFRSRVNFPRFIAEFGPAVVDNFIKLYALAKRNSKITAKQMQRFCLEIGAPLESAPQELTKLFNPQLIDAVFVVTEQAFNADVLRHLLTKRLLAAGVDVHLGCAVEHIEARLDGVEVQTSQGVSWHAPMVFNCTYSGLQRVLGNEAANVLALKHEITELALVEPPSVLAGIGVTVMDGPFFSCMPFPARGLHSLSHVRYTPHQSWQETGTIDPYGALESYAKEQRVERMVLDATRYLPSMARCRPTESLFEVKTVLTKNEVDDGRPILFKRHAPSGRLFSVLGSKIDNIYDILERLDDEALPEAA
jgi:glycine/D-amino acid oxidase-like deaminating enzyme